MSTLKTFGIRCTQIAWKIWMVSEYDFCPAVLHCIAEAQTGCPKVLQSIAASGSKEADET
jgi:hypothetical protein